MKSPKGPLGNIRSIAVLKFRNIGDVLLATPVFRALRSRYPQAGIAAVVNEGTEEMLTGNPDIDRIIVYRRPDRTSSGWKRVSAEVSLLREIRSWRPDLTVSLTEGDRGAFLSLLSGAACRIGVSSFGTGFRWKDRIFTHLHRGKIGFRHEALYNLDILSAAAIPPADRTLRFFFSPEDERRARTILQEAGVPEGAPYAVVHPCSRWVFKCWGDGKMASVMAHLADRGITPVVTSGPAEAEIERAARVAEAYGNPRANVGGKLTLKEMGALLASARLYVGVDTAAMHIAAAVGTPVVALFGPTSAIRWAPWEGMEWGYSRERMAGTVSVGRHIVVQKDWECVPCRRAGCEDSKRSRCLEETGVEEVLEAVDRVQTAHQTGK